MIETLDIQLDPRTAAVDEKLKKAVSSRLGVAEDRIVRIDRVRRSIDARQRNIKINLSLRVHIDEIEPAHEAPDFTLRGINVSESPYKTIVVGAGPAGLFAALRLISEGICPIVLERGKDVDTRRRDLAGISRTQTVDPDSNYAFGEGGAGTFSDGKLFTRSKKRGNVGDILHTLVQHGASEDILIDAHPHIGTNQLPEIIKRIRQTIERCGGQVHFNTRVTELVFDDKKQEVVGVKTANNQIFTGPVILATGHSARDIYNHLVAAGVSVEPKGIAVGARLEHPAALIDRLQYHLGPDRDRGPYLPTAEYSMLTRVGDRAVYSFCMCPGGVVVPAATAPGQLVVNGMSSSSRGSKWSNSAMVVEILPDDVPGDREDPLRVMHFQESIEKVFSEDAEGTQNAPAQRMGDFVNGRHSENLPASSYAPGVHSSRLDKLLPDFVVSRLRKGFREFDRKQPGFLTNDALLIGAETRTSAPVRIPRDKGTLSHVQLKGLYPAGEGAGYAGGIVSAAIDGQRCADAISAMLKKNI